MIEVIKDADYKFYCDACGKLIPDNKFCPITVQDTHYHKKNLELCPECFESKKFTMRELLDMKSSLNYPN